MTVEVKGIKDNWVTMRQLILSLLSDGEVHTRKEVTNFVQSTMGTDFNLNSLSTCLYDLRKKEKIKIVKRGCYALTDGGNKSLAFKSHNILNNTIESLRKSASTIDVFNITDNDKITINLVKDMISQIEKVQDKLEKII